MRRKSVFGGVRAYSNDGAPPPHQNERSRRYLAEQRVEAVQLVPVAIVNEASSVNEPPAPAAPEVVKSVVPTGLIEVRIGRTVVKVDGIVDAEMLRTVLGSLRL
jgi:transposase